MDLIPTIWAYVVAFSQTTLGSITIIVVTICVLVGVAQAFLCFSKDTMRSILFGAFWVGVVLFLFYNRGTIGGWIEGIANLPAN